LATGSWDQTARLWNVATHQLIGTLTGDTNWVNAVAFSPDGQTLATAGEDGTVRLWDVATQQQIGASLTDGSDSIDSLAFSPDGQTLATGNGDDAVQLWNVSYLTNLPSYICASTGTSFNRPEWAYYVPGLAYQNICP
jgi:WD40 repeat protein